MKIWLISFFRYFSIWRLNIIKTHAIVNLASSCIPGGEARVTVAVNAFVYVSVYLFRLVHCHQPLHTCSDAAYSTKRWRLHSVTGNNTPLHIRLVSSFSAENIRPKYILLACSNNLPFILILHSILPLFVLLLNRYVKYFLCFVYNFIFRVLLDRSRR